MARIRTIKPEFWTDEKVVECSVMARLLFVGLWNFSDDAGRMTYSPKSIKMKIFPGDDISGEGVHALITELSLNDLVFLYTVDNKDFLQVKGWHHQKINRPNESKIPLNPESNHGAFSDQAPPEGKGREGKGKEGKEKPPSEEKRKFRGSRLAENWVPDETQYMRLVKSGVSRKFIDAEHQKFLNYWISKAGKDASKLDWARTFDNWMIMAKERAAPQQGPRPIPPGSRNPTGYQG
ncbi:MAG: hypothetical protein JKY34_07395 [Kordiimonadaceae bacterium]|nr:hypothetical protein [Kordiimonadaceae bacterium]